jgi:hypothetical protein
MRHTQFQARLLVLAAAIFAASCGSTREPSGVPTTPTPATPTPPFQVSLIAPGQYTLTVTTDDTCTAIPGALRTRTYATTVSQTSDSHYSAVLPPAPGFSGLGFGITAAGQDLSFLIDGPAFNEVLPSFTYLEIFGSGSTTVEASAPPTVEFRFDASFSYCVLKSEMGRFNNCFTTPADQKLTYSQCFSRNGRMILARR